MEVDVIHKITLYKKKISNKHVVFLSENERKVGEREFVFDRANSIASSITEKFRILSIY